MTLIIDHYRYLGNTDTISGKKVTDTHYRSS